MVMNNNDTGPGSLREVISCVPDGAVVSFTPSLMGQNIVLTSGEILINKDLTISGLGMMDLMVSGNNASRVFQLMPGNTLRLEDLTLKNSTSASNGGAVWVKGSLILENVMLQNNFENGVPKSMTLQSPGSLEVIGTIQIKY
jgi:hypothetical protein